MAQSSPGDVASSLAANSAAFAARASERAKLATAQETAARAEAQVSSLQETVSQLQALLSGAPPDVQRMAAMVVEKGELEAAVREAQGAAKRYARRADDAQAQLELLQRQLRSYALSQLEGGAGGAAAAGFDGADADGDFSGMRMGMLAADSVGRGALALELDSGGADDENGTGLEVSAPSPVKAPVRAIEYVGSSVFSAFRSAGAGDSEEVAREIGGEISAKMDADKLKELENLLSQAVCQLAGQQVAARPIDMSFLSYSRHGHCEERHGPCEERRGRGEALVSAYAALVRACSRPRVCEMECALPRASACACASAWASVSRCACVCAVACICTFALCVWAYPRPRPRARL
eukprot:6194538-Pleurochrysis_carterae.AAC.3